MLIEVGQVAQNLSLRLVEEKMVGAEMGGYFWYVASSKNNTVRHSGGYIAEHLTLCV